MSDPEQTPGGLKWVPHPNPTRTSIHTECDRTETQFALHQAQDGTYILFLLSYETSTIREFPDAPSAIAWANAYSTLGPEALGVYPDRKN